MSSESTQCYHGYFTYKELECFFNNIKSLSIINTFYQTILTQHDLCKKGGYTKYVKELNYDYDIHKSFYIQYDKAEHKRFIQLVEHWLPLLDNSSPI